jgi:glutamate racemase
MDDRPLGVFDSGVGGLTILREIRLQAPREECVYVADSLEAPYGTKRPAEIRARSDAIVRFLLEQGAKAIVVACNTASVFALQYLRGHYPIPFVGLDPGVKPAAKQTKVGKIGVLATPATVASPRLAQLIQQHAYGALVLTQECPGLVPLIEQGIVAGPTIDRLLESYLAPILDAGADVVVLGCTHYGFARPAIERICGPNVAIVDPCAAVARQVTRVLARQGLETSAELGGATYYTTGASGDFARVLTALTGVPADSARHVEIRSPVA